ncbi:putative response regulatory protein [Lachnospiraceae bacterium]|jgi:Response regulator containing CheY-like receiver domain and AraC-type DNA-binding domain|nr:putative response regulatory protein [Lachnospiraceae bacterium]
MYQVLLIDDEPIIQLGIRKMIPWEDTPYQLCGTAPNGQDALDFIQNNPVDMIITDLKMPVMDGISLIRTLKARQINIPVLVLSNYSDFDLVREALLEGAVDYLLKVDLSKDSLLGQLDKMAAKVKRTQADQLQKQQQELMLAKKNKEVFLAKLRSFFLDSHYTYEDLCEQVDSPEYFVPPFLIMTIIFREADMKKEKMHRVLPHIESMAAAVFSPCKTILIYLHHNELLCIVSAFSLTEDELLPKARQLQRQLATYFSSAPVLCCKETIESIYLLKESYEQCAQAFGFTFYQPGLFVIQVSPRHKIQKENTENPDTLISMISDDS